MAPERRGRRREQGGKRQGRRRRVTVKDKRGVMTMSDRREERQMNQGECKTERGGEGGREGGGRRKRAR